MQNLEVLAWKMTKLWPIALSSPKWYPWVSQWVSESVTTLGIELLFAAKNVQTYKYLSLDKNEYGYYSRAYGISFLDEWNELYDYCSKLQMSKIRQNDKKITYIEEARASTIQKIFTWFLQEIKIFEWRYRNKKKQVRHLFPYVWKSTKLIGGNLSPFTPF